MGFTDWLGEQGHRLAFQGSRLSNATQGLYGGGDGAGADTSGLNWAGVKSAPGESMGGDFMNTWRMGAMGGPTTERSRLFSR